MPTHPTLWTADLDARYELLDEAGRGGMGVVYKARDRETGEIVALKILKPEIAADRIAAERFLNEVRLSRRITHKNVTRVYEFTRAGATAYLSMEYVEGESLRSIIERMGAVNLRKGIEIARQICSALHEAHSQGIVHRDLKPENVMIDRAGHVKVMDFGIARLLDASVTSTAGGIIGTPAYMAPEQAEGGDVDARTDIYAVGLILYEIFTGRAAFTGDTPMVVALKQIRETAPPPRTIDPSLPWELDATIVRCLEKDPAQRFQSVAELDAALAAVMSGTRTTGALPVDPEARASGAPTWPSVAHERTTPLGVREPDQPREKTIAASPRRRRRRAWIAAAAAALVVLVAAVLLLRSDEPIPFERFTLQNGLRVLLIEDHSAPTIAVAVTYDVGAKDDPPGREGLAHLFEHMMFSGSLNVGKGEHHLLVSTQGGQPNGNAFMDHTQVWETLPANQLELALFLEADRMRSLRLDQARLDTERGTVIAERQQRVENQPYGRVMGALYAKAYDLRPYQKQHLGSDEGLRAITLQEVNDFFRIFYAPNNAVLSVAGDFDPREARRLIERYFEHIPAQPPAPHIDLTETPAPGERRIVVEDPFAPGPRTYLAYKTAPGASEDIAPLMVLSSLLVDSTASRLQQRLVRETEAATALGGSFELRTGLSLMTFVLAAGPNRDEPAVLKAFDEEIARVRSEGVSAEEVTRARSRLRLSRAMTLQSTAQRALLLGDYEVRFGDAAVANRRLTRVGEVTADDVTRVAREYLVPDRRTIASVVPAEAEPPTFKAAADPAPQVVSAVERLNRAPVNKDVLRVSLPAARETSLDNGLAVLVAEDTRAPLVVVRLEFAGAGMRHLSERNPALAIATSLMMSEGTVGRTSREIAEALDTFGAAITWNQTGDYSAMYLEATGLSDTFDEWFPIVADMVMNPSFPADVLTTTKRRLSAEWQRRRSLPATLAVEVFDQAMYGPAGGRRIPPDAFASLTSDQLQAWHRERYTPQHTIVSIAGATEYDRALGVVRDTLGRWERQGVASPDVPVFAPTAPRVFVVDRPGSVQTTVMMGVPAPSRSDPDHLPLTVANRVLGGGPASRLFVKMRDERGLTFGAWSLLNAFKDRGDWRVTSDINSTRIGEGLETMVGELRRIAAERVPDGELDDARRSIVASFALTLEQLQQVVQYMAARRSYGLSADYWDGYPEKLMAVTAADVQRAASRYMDFSKLQAVAVGDAARLEPLLAPLGEVTVTK